MSKKEQAESEDGDDEPLPEVTPEFEKAAARLYMVAHRNRVIAVPGWTFSWPESVPEILPMDAPDTPDEEPVLSLCFDEDMFPSPTPKDVPEEALQVSGLVNFTIIGRAARAQMMHVVLRPGEVNASIVMRLEVVFESLQELLQFLVRPSETGWQRRQHRRRRRE